jgi:hypothetical protein
VLADGPEVLLDQLSRHDRVSTKQRVHDLSVLFAIGSPGQPAPERPAGQLIVFQVSDDTERNRVAVAGGGSVVASGAEPGRARP